MATNTIDTTVDIARKQLEDYRQVINDALEQFFVDLPGLLELDVSKEATDVLNKIEEYSLRPGKRIRGALACFAYDYITGQKYGKTGLQAAIALELVQNYLLIVDDVMDRSALRRGKPTIHELYLAEQSGAEKDTHLANMLAINVGLIAQHLVNIALMQATEDPARLQEATLLLHRNITATGFGQIDDACQQVGKQFSEEDVLRKYTLKSSYYTFVSPLQIGLVLGGQNGPKVLQEVTDFGLPAGIAFQLQDDLLGVFGSSDATGKPNTDDIEEGKITLLVQYALTHASREEKQFLTRVLGKPNITEEDFARVRHIFEASGAKQYVQKKTDMYAQEAKSCVLQSRFWDEGAKDLLTGLVEYSTSRKK